jgi:hypothetical protein
MLVAELNSWDRGVGVNRRGGALSISAPLGGIIADKFKRRT